MASIFTRIIQGELPGRFVWRDDKAVAFMEIAPMKVGHTLVVPIEEIDHWLDLDADLASHMFAVAHTIGRAQMAAFSPKRVGLLIAGLEVPHCHVHVVPIQREKELSFANSDAGATPEALDDAADRLRGALRDLGYDPPRA
jgi:histidine triad (HIT) family protein